MSAIERAVENMRPLVSQDMDPAMQQAWLEDLARAALSTPPSDPGEVRAKALEEAAAVVIQRARSALVTTTRLGQVNRAHDTAEAIRALISTPIAPAGESNDHPVMRAILDVRHKAAASFTPEFSGLRGGDYDRGVIDCYKAVQAALTGIHGETGNG